ncbi:DUF6502 family protein [Tritonibacter multivorans]|uniref:DUF6502 family protein n=1 Tax=Tritonibacter multivorans TaxID=928856 RepID=UPI00071C95C6|nr:DUF6502 family protein [Tritonibacter multivorans]MDA7421677.1 DUF6502 family protein [Tritonibacter multivorans]
MFEQTIKMLLRPLTRALIAQGVTAPQLYRLVKQSYVETALAELGDKATDSRVSVMTGVHRRDVKSLRSADPSAVAPVRRRVSTLATVVGRWMSTPQLTNTDGHPKTLTRAEFDQLVSQINRDIRPKTLLDELQRQGLVTASDGALRLDPEGVFGPEDLDQKLDFFAHNLGDHMEAAVDNLLAQTPPRFERATFYNYLTVQSVDDLEADARDIGMKALRHIAREAAERQDQDRKTAAATHRFRFGMYFYREDEEE